MRKVIYVLLILLAFIFLWKDIVMDFEYHSAVIGPMQTAERAKILEVIPKGNGEDIKIQLLTGNYKGNTYLIQNNYFHTDYYVQSFKRNEKVIVKVDRSEDQKEPGITVLNYARDTYSFFLVFIFLLLLILIGKKHGLKTGISLMLTIYMILEVMIPLILSGFNPILSAIGCCIIISILNLIIITGISLKSIATLIGTSIGVVVAGALAYLVGLLSRFSGLADEDSLLLTNVNQGTFDITGILFAGIIIGTLGAVMDVSMSISSSMYEIQQNNPDISKIKLIQSGLSIGRDVMGTMADTLILAYVGTAIPLLLFSINKETPLIILLNSEGISTEILRALSGSIGIILSIPATSLVFTLLLHKKSKNGFAKDDVNFRVSPEQTDNLIGKLMRSEKLIIMEQSSNWYKVKRQNGETGWVREDGVSLKNRKR